jgi:hypothetical protein
LGWLLAEDRPLDLRGQRDPLGSRQYVLTIHLFPMQHGLLQFEPVLLDYCEGPLLFRFVEPFLAEEEQLVEGFYAVASNEGSQSV